MLNPNATLHEATVLGEQQVLETSPKQHEQTLRTTSSKEKKSVVVQG